MYRISVLAGLLAFAAPAMAQETPPPNAHPPGHPAPAAQTPAPPAGRPATAAEVGAMVAGEFPRRDADSNGSLSQDEFKSWLMELIAAGPGQSATAPAPNLDARIATAFTNTDTDSSHGISPDEMTALLSRAGR